MPNRSQVTRGSAAISQPQVRIEPSGTHGTHGVLNPRGRPGSVLRRMMIPAATRMKAKAVPMLQRSTTSSIFITPANAATSRPVNRVERWGVRYLGCTAAAQGGSKPSRAMLKKMRVWPS